MHRLKPLRIWILFTVVFFVFLSISPFILPMGWMYACYFSWIFVFSFLGLFSVSYVVLEVSLLFNDWVYDVEGMDFLGNSMFMTWLYATDRRRWIRWAVPMITSAGILFGVAFSIIVFWGHITQESFLVGNIFSTLLLFLFSFIFYNLYTKWLEIPKSSVRRRKKILDQVKR